MNSRNIVGSPFKALYSLCVNARSGVFTYSVLSNRQWGMRQNRVPHTCTPYPVTSVFYDKPAHRRVAGIGMNAVVAVFCYLYFFDIPWTANDIRRLRMCLHRGQGVYFHEVQVCL